MTTLLSLIAGLLMWTTLASAQVEVGVVLPFENNTNDPKLDWVSESFAEVLSTHLSTSRLLMVDRRERASAFDNLGIPTARILSNATIYKVAEVLDTDRVVIGRYEYDDGVFSASAQVLSMAGPALSKAMTEQGPLNSLLAIQTALAWQIQKFLQPEYPYSKEEFVAERVGPRLDAFEIYIRGLIAKDRQPQIQLYRTADRLDPQFTKPAFELGLIYYHERDYRTSILWLTKLRRNDPDYLEANYFLGLAYLYQGQYDRSAAAFRVVENDLPLNEVYNNLGIALARGDKPGAIQYFQKAAASDAADPDYQFNLGFAYWKRSECDHAVGPLGAALERLNFAAGRAIYADCLNRLGRSAESAAEARRLPASFNVADVAKLVHLERPKDKYDGVSFRQLTRLVQIQEELKHAKLSAGEHAEIHFQRAMRDSAEGREREAIGQLRQALDYDPQDSRAHRELARIHLKAGRLEDAARAASRALHWEKTSEGYILLAQIQIQQGRKYDALVSAESALSIDPASVSAAALTATLKEETASATSNR